MVLPKIAVAFAALTLVGLGDATPCKIKKSKKCVATNLIQNPSFDTESDGDFDGAPWRLEDDGKNPKVTVSEDVVLARTGEHLAYVHHPYPLNDPWPCVFLTLLHSFFDIDSETQRPRIIQSVSKIKTGKTYDLVYYSLVAKGQPKAAAECFTYVTLYDGQVFQSKQITAPVTLDTYSKQQVSFNATGSKTEIEIGVLCQNDAGDGVQVAIDDVSLYEEDPKCPPPSE
ncbi:hypothetical protein FZEAL_8554 [Fusarium zealandicum]|uniref:Uncharacterized protein n=1 Tax=Fusarium zealandicum TaxID=1053134 RepID=A0A8H4XGP1_9HYPO|nr:hypothetical protein FZEAL_8554 [Fusarium zealandicum]